MEFITKTKSYILPGTDRKVEISYQINIGDLDESDFLKICGNYRCSENVWESQFLKNFGILFYQNKPSNITWSKYYYVLNDQPIPIVYEESSTELADLATRTGDLGLLYSISQQNPSIFPSIEAINMAAREGYLDVLK